MRREKLGIEHIDTIKERLRSLRHGLSEYSFANLYLFRRKHKYEVIFDEHLAVYGKTYDNQSFLMPLFDISAVHSEYLAHIMQGAQFLFPIHESVLGRCGREPFSVSYNDDDSDYIYLFRKLASYEGNTLRGKKNLAKRFFEHCRPVSSPLDETNRDDATLVLNQWQKQAGTSPYSTDFIPCLEALHYREALELFGFIYYVKDMPCGLVMAEELTAETCALHFIKGNTAFKGIYEYMVQHFAASCSSKYRYCNLEQDLGLAGLKKAKSQYCPDLMYKKYRIHVGACLDSSLAAKFSPAPVLAPQ